MFILRNSNIAVNKNITIIIKIFSSFFLYICVIYIFIKALQQKRNIN